MIQDQNGPVPSDQNQQPSPAQPSPSQPTPGQQPAGAAPADFDPGATPAPQPEDTTPANFQLGALLPKELKVKIPAHELKFDEPYFLRLLAGSISLNKMEKKRIIETIPKLKQYQVDELIRIFEEEKFKFSQLSAKHVPQLEKLAKTYAQDWIDLENEQVAGEKKKNDEAAAEEIRKSLGL